MCTKFVSCTAVDRCSTKYAYTFTKQPPTPAPPTPPTPPPTPAPPTPAPQPGTFSCHDQFTFTNPQRMPDNDDTAKVTLDACKQSCKATKGCAVTNWHAQDGHCHTLTGHVSAADYESALSPLAGYTTCRLN
jgi:hypothetical protein